MTFDELPGWAQTEVLKDIARCFPEMRKGEILDYVHKNLW